VATGARLEVADFLARARTVDWEALEALEALACDVVADAGAPEASTLFITPRAAERKPYRSRATNATTPERIATPICASGLPPHTADVAAIMDAMSTARGHVACVKRTPSVPIKQVKTHARGKRIEMNGSILRVA
jgi:hypothetical protein